MKKLILSLSCVLIGLTAAAQNFNTGFFLDNYIYGYRLNPAFQYDKDFFGFIFNNVQISPESNFGAASLLYPNPSGTGLVTGLNSAIDAKTFLGNLNKDNLMGAGLNCSIFSFGQKKEKFDYNFEVLLKGYGQADLPIEAFTFLKNGSSENAYDLSRTSADVKSYLEASFGYSRKIGKKVTVGAKIKLMMGIASANLSANTFNLTVNGDHWASTADARIRMAAPFLRAKTDPGTDIMNFEFESTNNFAPSGFGGGVDLGVVYKPVKGLTLSFSALDLGCIGWKNNINGIDQGTFYYDGLDEVDILKGNVGEEISKALEQLKNVTNFRLTETSGLEAEVLPMSFNLGARYAMPFYEKWSVGVLASFRTYRKFTSTDVRIGTTVTPLKWLSLAANVGLGTYGTNIGAAFTIDAGPVNLFLGGEFAVGKYGKYKNVPVPLGVSHNCLNFGLSFTL